MGVKSRWRAAKGRSSGEGQEVLRALPLMSCPLSSFAGRSSPGDGPPQATSRPGPELPSGLLGRAKPISLRRETFPPTILRIHVPAKPIRPTAPSKRVSDKRGVHSLLVSGSRAPLPPPWHLLPFPASCSSGIRPPTAGPLRGRLCGCIGSRRPPAGPRGSRGAQAAFRRGPWRAGAAVRGCGRRAGGARGAHLSHAVLMAGMRRRRRRRRRGLRSPQYTHP